MPKSQDSNVTHEVHIVQWTAQTQITQEEAEAHLHREGFKSFRWHDVPGMQYPTHRHDLDECIWILQGELQFTLRNQVHRLKPGDRIYLPARASHQAKVLGSQGATYLVGQKDPTPRK